MKNPRADDDGFAASLTAIAIIAAVLLLFPIFFASPPGLLGLIKDRWRETVSEFQTLFAGVLAVLAALLTVRQMQISDRRQDERHDELVRLQTRTDKIKIERIINPPLRKFKHAVADLRLEFEDVEVEGRIDGVKYNELSVRLTRAYSAMRTVRDIIGTSTWSDAAELFDGELSAAFMRLGDHLTHFINALATVKTDQLPDTSGMDLIGKLDVLSSAFSRRSQIPHLEKLRRHFVAAADDVIFSVEKMAIEYRINLEK